MPQGRSTTAHHHGAESAHYRFATNHTLQLAAALALLVSIGGCGHTHSPSVPPLTNLPCLVSVEPASAVAGATITIIGQGFGSDAARVQVFFGEEAGQIVSVSDAAISVMVPLDGEGALRVLVDGREVVGVASFTYLVETLVVTGFAPREGPPGTPVLITGGGFGAIPEWLEVTFGGVSAAILSVTPEEIETAVPPGAASGPLTVKRGRQKVTTGDIFTVTEPVPPVQPPEIEAFAPKAVYPLGSVTLSGKNFGTDLAATAVFVGGKEALVVALAEDELVFQPVPGTVDGAIRVQTSGGTAESGDELSIKRYPDYFMRIQAVSTTTVGPGGIISFAKAGSVGTGVRTPVLGGVELDHLTYVGEGSDRRYIYRVPPGHEGTFYLGYPQRVKEEDAWVAAYYEEPITVTSEGMSPPEVTGLSPDTIFGSLFHGEAMVSLIDGDYSEPMAVLADGRFIYYYQGTDDPEELAEYEEQGGFPIGFANPPEILEPGNHSLTVASGQGSTTADPGYRLATVDEIECSIDNIGPSTAKVGDVVTVSGENLYFKGTGGLGWSVLQVRIGGVPVPVIPLDTFLVYNTSVDELRFIVSAEAAAGGEVVVDIQRNEPWVVGEVYRTIESGKELSVDSGFLDRLDKQYLPKGAAGGHVAENLIHDNLFTSLAATGELYLAWRDFVAWDEEYLRWGYVKDGGFVDLGRIDQAPIIYGDYPQGTSGPFMWDGSVKVRPNGDIHLFYATGDSRGPLLEPEVEHWENRLAIVHGDEIAIETYNLYDTLTGEGSEEDRYGVLAYDELGNIVMLIRKRILTRTEAGWTEIGEGPPRFTHQDPQWGELEITLSTPMYAHSSGLLKLFGYVEEPGPPFRRLATYFITRSPDGEWDKQQILGRYQWFKELAFDTEGRGRMFRNDDTQLYVYREETGFAVKEPWLPIPFPGGSEIPLYYCQTPEGYPEPTWGFLRLEIEYDHLNRPVGWLQLALASDWELEGTGQYGAFSVFYLIGPSPSTGEIVIEPVSAFPSDSFLSTAGATLNGLEVDFHPSLSALQLNPARDTLMVTGSRITYRNEFPTYYDIHDIALCAWSW